MSFEVLLELRRLGIDDGLTKGAYKDFVGRVDDETKLGEPWHDYGTISRLLMAYALGRRALPAFCLVLGPFKMGVIELHECVDEEKEIEEVYDKGISVISLR